MRIAYEPASDRVRVELLPDVPVASVREVNGIVLRYGADRRVVGIEIREAGERIAMAVEQHAALA